MGRGVEFNFSGKYYICSSPFSNDTTWSFVVYPTNTFYCWSTGKWGGLYDLIQHYEGCPRHTAIQIADTLDIPDHDLERDFTGKKESYEKSKGPFDYRKYINTDKQSVKAIFAYAKSRGINSGFLPGRYFTRVYNSGGDYELAEHSALMFLHTDLKGNICGAKFRNIDNTVCPRFAARGSLGVYTLDTNISETWKKRKIWLCESETSSNSLWSYFKNISCPATIICFGGVSSPPKELPPNCEDRKVFLVIDYDGNEELYKKRLEKYAHLNCKPIKMILPKGEDINSLYCRGEMWKIENLLLN